MVQKKSKHKIQPKACKEALKGVNLEDLYLIESKNIQKRENIKEQKNIEITINDRATYEKTDEGALVTHKYFLTAKDPEAKDFAFKISASYRLVYTSEVPFTNDFFEIFTGLNLPLNAWPFFREFVQNTTQRMNVRPLTLPLVMRS